jgi:hypothetical protein
LPSISSFRIISIMPGFISVFVLCALVAVDGAAQMGRRSSRDKKTIVVARDGSGQYGSIQEAIDNAEADSWIRIRSGIYREDVHLKSFVNLQGDGVGRTVIVGTGAGPVVSAYNLSGTRLVDLTIQFASPAPYPVLSFRYSSVNVQNCLVRNGATGIEAYGHSTVRLRNTWLSDHTGDGLRLSIRSEAYVQDSRIENNDGDGIRIEHASGCNGDRLIVRRNRGHGVSLKDRSVGNFLGNYLYDNRGGGLRAENSVPVIRNNTFVRNGDSAGYAVRLERVTSAGLSNNLVVSGYGGFRVFESQTVTMSHNAVWDLAVPYDGIEGGPTALEAPPRFVNPAIYDFRLDPSSALYHKGEGRVSIGADFDYDKSAKRQRLDYLRNQVTKDLVRGNWYLAYQGAREMIEIDSTGGEGQSLFKKASSHLAEAYAEQAREEFNRGNLSLATNTLRFAEKYDASNEAVKALRERIDEASRASQIRFFSVIGVLAVSVVGLGYVLRKWIRQRDAQRQVQWWLEDAEEHVEMMQAAEGASYDADATREALNAIEKARGAFARKEWDETERHCADTVHYANRARDAAERYHRLKRDAIFDTGNAETEMMHFKTSDTSGRFYSEIADLQARLQKAQDAIVGQRYGDARDLAAQIVEAIRNLRTVSAQERDREILSLFQETETLIIDALASNSSADVISVVIDFKSDLEVLKTGFTAGQLDAEETRHQVRQIRDFINEAMKIGEPGAGASRRKRTYYEILGVKEDATLEQIKQVYRKLSMIYHPDVNQDMGIAGDERFREIKEAYDALMLEKTNGGRS